MGNKNIEKFFKSNFEKPKIEKELTIEREAVIDGLIDDLAERERMEPDDVLSDIITFAPYEGNEDMADAPYLEIVAEKIGITQREMILYAIEKAKDFLEK